MNNNKKNIVKNPIEQFRDGSPDRATQNEILKPFISEFKKQILGGQKFSGEIELGTQVEMKRVVTGEQESIQKEREQLQLERVLLQEEKVLVEKKSRELKLQIEAIQVQTTKLVEVTPKLAREVQIAAFQAPSSVSIYELFFLQHIHKLIQSFTEDIKKAHVWLYKANQRARKKNVWGQNVEEYGAKYFMSGEHYSGRSAA